MPLAKFLRWTVREPTVSECNDIHLLHMHYGFSVWAKLTPSTNALNQVTTFNAYNADGQPLTHHGSQQCCLGRLPMILGNGSRLGTVGGETTTLSYWPTGDLEVATLPDGSYLTYTYDSAHRLTQITDGLGNKILYTVDAMGNRTAENDYDPSNTLVRTHTQIYVSAQASAVLTWIKTEVIAGTPLEQIRPRACFASR